MIDPKLKEWGTERQVHYIDLVSAHGSVRAAAAAAGVNESSIRESLKRLKAHAETQGYSPEHGWLHSVPDTYKAKGVSTYYPVVKREDGTVVQPGQWLKADLRQEAYNEMVKSAIAAFIEDVPQITPAPGPANPQSDIIPWIQIGDAHVGLLCHADEVGASYDLKIAEADLIAAIYRLIDEAPNSDRIVINDLGDGTHIQNFDGISESGHAFDYDSRISKVIRVYSRIMRAVIDKALTKANHVDVLINQGNHSRMNDIWMRELLDVAYGHSGRVNILNNGSVFIAYRMGKTLVMVHHSDKCKPKDLIGVMTTDYRRDFGETEFHYIDIGHVHHHFVSKEHPSVVIESWNHLAATDKWAHDLGYRARKSISMVFRSKTYGEVGRRLLPIQEVHDLLAQSGRPSPVAPKVAFTV